MRGMKLVAFLTRLVLIIGPWKFGPRVYDMLTGEPVAQKFVLVSTFMLISLGLALFVSSLFTTKSQRTS